MTESIKKLAFVLSACLGLGACLAGQASADASHVYARSIGSATSSPAAPYPIDAPTDVAVDQSTRDVYVTDPPHYRVQKFDSAGNFLLMFGKEVNATTGGNVCTAASNDTCKAGVSTPSPAGFQFPEYLAVDNYPNGEGAVYVGDRTGTVKKFTSGGALMTSWGLGGQKDGSDAFDLPGFEEIDGLAIGGRCASPSKRTWSANCEPVGTLYVNANRTFGNRVFLYTQSGEYIKWSIAGGRWVKADPDGKWYTEFPGSFFGGPPTIQKWLPEPGGEQNAFPDAMVTDFPTAGFAFDEGTEELYQATLTRGGEEPHAPRINHYPPCNPEAVGPCEPLDSFGEAELNEPAGMSVDRASHAIFVANEGSDEVLVFDDARPIVTTGAPTDLSDSEVTLTGTIDPAGRGSISTCYFEYGFERSYGEKIPCEPDPSANPPGSYFDSPTPVTATISGLSPGTTGHYRLVATNVVDGFGAGLDATFSSTAAPAITGLAAERLTATSADIVAQINPNGRDTNYRVEFGTSLAYGQVAPLEDGSLSASFGSVPIEVPLRGLTAGAVYHYRLVAESVSGVTAAEDHTFNFYPPSCPNENVRQQTEANFLPDCRAYELVSPADAGGTQLFPSGPAAGHATNPPRFAFMGLLSTIPGSGGSPIDSNGDLYVSTRTGQGWVTRYVGWPSTDAPAVGGPPLGLPGSVQVSGKFAVNSVLTDLGMNRFLSFNDGLQGEFDVNNRGAIASNAPRVFAADGTFLERWPTNLSVVPDGQYPSDEEFFAHGGLPFPGEEPTTVAPGGSRALDCPTTTFSGGEHAAISYCPGDVTASGDLTNFVFATAWHVFAPGGQLSAPGSVYDNDTTAGTVVVASKTPAGENIQSEPADQSGTPLEIRKVSSDGSHILIAANQTGPCGFPTCANPPCGTVVEKVRRCPVQAAHLYMRVDGTVTYDVSRGHAVRYVGTDADATTVYFLSDERLTSDDLDASTDLYRWTEDGDQLTLISRGAGESYGDPGNSDACDGGFTTSYETHTTKCGVTTYTHWYFCGEQGGGNCTSDNSIAPDSGDIYFFSPERLDGTRGLKEQENLYVFRNGDVHYVTTLTGPPTCVKLLAFLSSACPRVVRMQVTASGSYMSFVTASPVTQYDNAGHQEMYRYNPETRDLICLSCKPSGDPPVSDTEGSLNGLFMADDGRAFFATEDGLVHTDTNKAQDVYEYVEGRPQLITLGTGDTRVPNAGALGNINPPGLVGVSVDGTDVFFGSYDTLVRQDKNGLFLKFYDARSGGGFSAPAPPPPCAAADECHGSASAPPSAMADGTAKSLGAGGNASGDPPKKKHGKKKRKKRHHKAGKRAQASPRGHGNGRRSK